MERQIELENLFTRCSRKEEAQKLLEACNDSKTFISIHDTQGMYLSVSETCQGFTGYSPQEMVGTSAYDHFHSEDFQAILKSHAKITIKPEVDMVDYRLRMKDGSYKAVRSLSKKIIGESGAEFILAFTIERE